MNVNPRSLYNKAAQFKIFIKEKNVQLVTVSESWQREDIPIEDLIDEENFTVISNPHQRKGRGGRPLIIADHTKYIVDKPDISCPWGVEMVWCILSPKNATSVSKIQKIIVGSFYSKPNSRAKRKLLDHISEVYHMMHSRFKTGLYFLIGADSNDLKLDDILNLECIMW